MTSYGCLEPVRLLTFANRSACGLGNALKIQIVYKSAGPFHSTSAHVQGIMVSQGHAKCWEPHDVSQAHAALIMCPTAKTPGICGSLSLSTMALSFPDFPVKFLASLSLHCFPHGGLQHQTNYYIGLPYSFASVSNNFQGNLFIFFSCHTPI